MEFIENLKKNTNGSGLSVSGGSSGRSSLFGDEGATLGVRRIGDVGTNV